MKKIASIIILYPIMATAATPDTSCPSGYVAITEQQITIATSCPSNTTPAGTAETCLATSPTGSCIMYIPANTSYTDDTGTYEYTEPCALS